eukprot:15090292-Heterocapsa_arctica.AAC.1
MLEHLLHHLEKSDNLFHRQCHEGKAESTKIASQSTKPTAKKKASKNVNIAQHVEINDNGVLRKTRIKPDKDAD